MPDSSLIGKLREFNYVAVERDGGAPKPCLKHFLELLAPRKIRYSFLEPRPAGQGNTLSDLHGLEEFPLHTDGANLISPPDYIFLMAPRSRVTPTLIADPRSVIDIDSSFARDAVFTIRRQGRNFPSFFVERSRGESMVRYNADTMIPQNSAAFKVVEFMSGLRHHAVQISWAKISLLVLNNRAMLHGRGNIAKPWSHLRRLEVYLK